MNVYETGWFVTTKSGGFTGGTNSSLDMFGDVVVSHSYKQLASFLQPQKGPTIGPIVTHDDTFVYNTFRHVLHHIIISRSSSPHFEKERFGLSKGYALRSLRSSWRMSQQLWQQLVTFSHCFPWVVFKSRFLYHIMSR